MKQQKEFLETILNRKSKSISDITAIVEHCLNTKKTILPSDSCYLNVLEEVKKTLSSLRCGIHIGQYDEIYVEPNLEWDSLYESVKIPIPVDDIKDVERYELCLR